MPYHPGHARQSPTQIVVGGLLVLLLAMLLVWSFRSGRERTRTEPTPASAPNAEPSPIDPAAAPASSGGPSR